mgnify:CR=1 FL=1
MNWVGAKFIDQHQSFFDGVVGAMPGWKIRFIERPGNYEISLFGDPGYDCVRSSLNTNMKTGKTPLKIKVNIRRGETSTYKVIIWDVNERYKEELSYWLCRLRNAGQPIGDFPAFSVSVEKTTRRGPYF